MKHFCISIALATLAALPCFGQQSTKPTTTIVGKEHPELIDDATAYWHLFRTLSRSDSYETDDMYQRRRLAFANKTGLTPTQVTQLLAAADNFTEQIAAFKYLPETAAIHDARTKVVLNIVAGLHQNIGSDASSILIYYVNTKVKPTITIFPPKQR